MSTVAPTASDRKALSRLTIGSLRELDTVAVIGALASFYASVLIMATASLTTYANHLDDLGEGESGVGTMLGTVASCFILIALFVAGLTIANGVTAVIAGRTEQVGLLRLLGASSDQLRSSLVRSVSAVAAAGAVVGALVGAVTLSIVREIMVARGTIMRLDYPYLSWTLLLAIGAVVATAVLATLTAARRTLRTSAVHASSAETTRRSTRTGRLIRGTIATLTAGIGVYMLAVAIALGEDPVSQGVIVAFFGSALCVLALLIGARLVVPALVSTVGRALGSDPASVIARRNAVLDPLRTTRSTMGILLGVTLITTVASGMDSVRISLIRTGEVTEDSTVISIVTWVMIAMIAISAVMSAVGFVSTMSLTVIGRTREIGLLRTLGLTTREVRQMIVKESVALSGTATVVGMLLGITFGAVGAQSLLGSINSGLVIGLPRGALAVIALGAAAVVLLSSVVPSRRAVSVSPVDAMSHS